MKLKYDKLVSNFAFNFNLLRCMSGEGVDAAVDQQALHPTVMDPKLWMVVVKQGKAGGGREQQPPDRRRIDESSSGSLTTSTRPTLNRRTKSAPARLNEHST